jgi:UDP-N-acetylmuramyl pentapeptide synthase
MNQEQPVENRKVGQGLTELAGRHPTGGNSSFDGNNFPIDVAETGASAALVSDPPRATNSLSGLSLLQVQDTLTMLHQLAPSYRQLMPLRPVCN